MFASVRHALVAVATVAVAMVPSVSIARGVAVRVMIVAPVAAPATAVMPATLWRRLVARYVGGTAVPTADSPAPTVDDCRAADADLLVTAPFALAPKLPGLPGSSDGRVSATTHVVAISCATGAIVLDRVVPLESDPPSDEEAGDFERDPELVWDHGVAVALARDRIDNALVRRQATIALAASVANARTTATTANATSATPASSARRTHGAQIPVYAATPAATRPAAATRTATPSADARTSPAAAAPLVVSATPARPSTAPTVVRRTPSRPAVTPPPAPLQRVATREGAAAPIARLVDLIDVSRIAGVTRPFAFLNVRDPSLQAGDRLIDFADAGHVLRAKPIELTVTENFGTYVQIVLDTTGDAAVPSKGDLVQKAPPNP